MMESEEKLSEQRFQDLQITDDGLEWNPKYERLDICWSYHISRKVRDEHPLGSWKDDREKRLIKAWHRKHMVIITTVQVGKFPYEATYAVVGVSTGWFGAWYYENFLSPLTRCDDRFLRKVERNPIPFPRKRNLK
jgi:hypothetical protein